MRCETSTWSETDVSRTTEFPLREVGCHALACVGMSSNTEEIGTWPNKFGHATLRL